MSISASCAGHRSREACEAVPGCASCGKSGCFEKALWDCPRRPHCFREAPELRGVEPGVPPAVFFFLVVGLAAAAVWLFLYWWGLLKSPSCLGAGRAVCCACPGSRRALRALRCPCGASSKGKPYAGGGEPDALLAISGTERSSPPQMGLLTRALIPEDALSLPYAPSPSNPPGSSAEAEAAAAATSTVPTSPSTSTNPFPFPSTPGSPSPSPHAAMATATATAALPAPPRASESAVWRRYYSNIRRLAPSPATDSPAAAPTRLHNALRSHEASAEAEVEDGEGGEDAETYPRGDLPRSASLQHVMFLDARRHPERWLELPQLDSPEDARDDPFIDDVLDESRREGRRLLALKCVVTGLVLPLVLFVCGFLVASFPSPIVLSTCDVRWDMDSVEKAALDPTSNTTGMAEVHVSIYNPNRFDVLLSRATALAKFHGRLFAEIEWASHIGGLEHLAAGAVADMRFVFTLARITPDELVQLGLALLSPRGIVLTMNSDVFIVLQLWGWTITPRMLLSSRGVEFPISDSNSLVCRCDPLPWEGIPPRHSRPGKLARGLAS